MAAYSIPNQYSPADYSSFSSEFCSLPICEQTSDLFNNMAPLVNYYDINSVVTQMSEIETGFSNFAVNCVYQNDNHQVFEPGDVCINGPYMAAENWALKDNNQVVTKVEETDQVKVGKYSGEERKDRILRYLKKRNQRNFNKTIKMKYEEDCWFEAAMANLMCLPNYC